MLAMALVHYHSLCYFCYVSENKCIRDIAVLYVISLVMLSILDFSRYSFTFHEYVCGVHECVYTCLWSPEVDATHLPL